MNWVIFELLLIICMVDQTHSPSSHKLKIFKKSHNHYHINYDVKKISEEILVTFTIDYYHVILRNIVCEKVNHANLL